MNLKTIEELEELNKMIFMIGNQTAKGIMIAAYGILKKNGINNHEMRRGANIRIIYGKNTIIQPAYFPNLELTIEIIVSFIFEAATKEWTTQSGYSFSTKDAAKYINDLIKFEKLLFNKMKIETAEGSLNIELSKDFMDNLYKGVHSVIKNQVEIKEELSKVNKNAEDVNQKIAEVKSTYDEIITQLKLGNKEKAEENFTKLSRAFKWLGKNILQPVAVGYLTYEVKKMIG